MDTSTSKPLEADRRVPLRRFDDLPGPRRVPIFGNLPQIESTRVHQQLEQWSAQYGPFFRLQLGKRRVIAVSDHEVIAAVLRDRPEGFRRTTRFEEVWSELGLPNGVFGANGETWRRQRRMVMAGFDPAHVKAYFPSLQRVAQRLAKRWQNAAELARPIDLQADLMRYTVDTIAGLAFGSEVNTLESDEDVIQNHLNRLFPVIFRRVFKRVPTWRFFPSADDRQLVRSVAEINAAVDGFVAQARARMRADPSLREHPRNLLEAMLVAADEPGSGIDDKQVAGNVLTMLLAGEDTTANTVAWMIYLLSRNPQALARAIDEVRSVCGDTAAPTPEQIGRLDFVEACAHETMRLKPVAPQIAFQALRDTTLRDVFVSEGMVVFLLMRRDAVSEHKVRNAAAFEPQRWLGDGGPAQAANAAKRISMPFGAGPRICPGRYLALLEMKMAMATLLGRFDIVSVDTPDGGEARESLSVTMAPVGLTMRVRPRGA
ncbi:MAG TPA: cytochrome P450 [Burkholderiaceae bacterium]|nr:cytochrome P450 [Burkholderiaceae bacterium]